MASIIDLTGDTSDDESDKEGSKKRPIDGSSSSRKKKKTYSLSSSDDEDNVDNNNNNYKKSSASGSSSSSKTATNKNTPFDDFDDFDLFYFDNNNVAKPEVDEKESLKELLTENPLKFERFSIVEISVLNGYYVVCNIYSSIFSWTETDEEFDEEKGKWKERRRRFRSNYVFTGFRIDKDDNKITKLEKLRTFMEKKTSQSDRLTYFDEFEERVGTNITELDLKHYSAPIITGSSWLSRFEKNDKKIVIQEINEEIEKQMNTSSNSKKTVEELTLIKLKF